MAKALASSNCSLTELDLSNNNMIGTDGALEIAKALRKNNRLVGLDLSDCAIGDAGAGAIFNVILSRSVPMRYLNLNSNNISYNLVETMKESLEELVTYVYLDDNRYEEE